ncbi:MAG: sulfatase [Planctomycetota bacterium]
MTSCNQRSTAPHHLLRAHRLLTTVVYVAFAALVVSANRIEAAEPAGDPTAANRPNVLMIAIDDLNDWVQPLGGHPLSQTPAMQSLAERGVTFTNAHCQSPLCNSSRTSLMLSLRPSTSGVYGLRPWFRNVERLHSVTSLPHHFHDHGYVTYSGGKVYHGGSDRKANGDMPREFDSYGPPGGTGIRPPEKLIPATPSGDHPLMDWGVFDHQDNQKGDWAVASWAEETLRKMPNDKPFFLAAGFFLPHVPCHVTQKWWDMYPGDASILVPIKRDDRADCSPFSWYLHWNLPEPRLSWLQHHKQRVNLTRAYLASISFVDSQVRRVLDALAETEHADNTLVVLWSDHGWHLGEKFLTGKNTLWEPSTRVPLIIAGPGITTGRCDQPAELLDIYPTLVDLAGLPTPNRPKGLPVEGISLRPQLQDPTLSRARPAITDHNPGNQGIRDQRYRLIRYADGSVELYDIRQDPHEWTNIAGQPEMEVVAKRLGAHVQSSPAPLAPGSAARVLEQRSDGWYWEGKKIDRDHPPMSIHPTKPSELP